MVCDKEQYVRTQKILSDALKELNVSDSAIQQLDSIGAGYYKDLVKDVDNAKRKVQSIEQEQLKLVRMDIDDAKPQKKRLEKALQDAEVELQTKMSILAEQNAIYRECDL